MIVLGGLMSSLGSLVNGRVDNWLIIIGNADFDACHAPTSVTICREKIFPLSGSSCLEQKVSIALIPYTEASLKQVVSKINKKLTLNT